MIRKQARDLCGRDVGRMVKVSVRDEISGKLMATLHTQDEVVLRIRTGENTTMLADSMVCVSPEETMEVSGA